MNSHKNGVTVASLSTLLTLEGLAAVVNRVTCSVPVPGSNPLCVRLSPPRCLTCSWACRVSSGPWGIVVVRASWPGHPTLIKKKKNVTCSIKLIHNSKILVNYPHWISMDIEVNFDNYSSPVRVFYFPSDKRIYFQNIIA